LANFADGQFDVVVLSQTLQTVIDVQTVIREMLRVGKRGVVSFPNLGYHKLREQLAVARPRPAGGSGRRQPLVRDAQRPLPDHRRFRGILPRPRRSRSTRSAVALDTEHGRRITEDPNRNADLAIVVLSR
jgi:homoserine O-acetyltransferase/O-succinyltransferase